MTDPEVPSDRVENKKENTRDSSSANRGIARAKKKQIRQFQKEKRRHKK